MRFANVRQLGTGQGGIRATRWHWQQSLVPAVIVAGCLVLTGGIFQSLSSAAKDVPVTGGRRWLSIQQIRGQVTLQGRPAKVGDRLQSVGQTLVTGNKSTAVLTLDDGISPVRVTENTELRIKTLKNQPDGGKITVLTVTRGQVRFQVRPFTHRSSRLNVETPAGVAAVRGTIFGVGVRPEGGTDVFTRKGAVAVSARDRTVLVTKGRTSKISPGQSPQLLPVNTNLDLQTLVSSGNQVKVVAQYDPVNTLWMNNQQVTVEQDGRLDAMFPIPANRRLRLVVRNPLGRQQVYDLAIP